MKGDGHTFYKKPWKFTSRWKFPQNGGPPKNDPSHSKRPATARLYRPTLSAIIGHL